MTDNGIIFQDGEISALRALVAALEKETISLRETIEGLKKESTLWQKRAEALRENISQLREWYFSLSCIDGKIVFAYSDGERVRKVFEQSILSEVPKWEDDK